MPLLARLGHVAIRGAAHGREMVTFLGDACLALGRFIGRRARLRRADLLVTIQAAPGRPCTSAHRCAAVHKDVRKSTLDPSHRVSPSRIPASPTRR
jgi:hypothetical protein